jgi:hypothetical protein
LIVVPESQATDALGFQLGEELLTDRAGGNLVQIVVTIKDVGQVEHFEVLDAQRAELGQRRREHLDSTELQRFHFFLVLVQRRVGINLDLDLATGQLASLLGKIIGRLALGRVIGDNVAELDDDGLLGKGRQRQRTGKQGNQKLGYFHCSLLQE